MTTVSVLLFLSLAVDNEAAGLRNACKASMQKAIPVSPDDIVAAEMIAGRIFASGTADMEALRCARRVRPWTRIVLGQYAAAEVEVLEALKTEPADALLAYWMSSALAGQKTPDKNAPALYYSARAAYLRGPGILEGPRLPSALYVVNRYTILHGNEDGLDELIELAKSSPFIPAGFEITRCGANGIPCPTASLRENPAAAFWVELKTALEGKGGVDYFNAGIRDAFIPGGVQRNGINLKRFHALVVAADPNGEMPSLLVRMTPSERPDVKLLVDKATAASIEPGSQCSFSGVANAFQQEPFQLVFDLTNQISILRCH